MFPGTLGGGVVGRALENRIWSYNAINIRDFAINNYGSVDDEQFGGGVGMVMRPEPLADAIDSLANPGKIIYFSPRGPTLNQKMVREFSADADATYIVAATAGASKASAICIKMPSLIVLTEIIKSAFFAHKPP